MHSTLVDWHREVLLEDAELLVSELVTNVIRHAGVDHASVGVIEEGDHLRIEVSDPCPTPLVRGGNTDPGQPGGLGLGIVDAIAWRWGVVQAERGKTVWFELELPTLPAPPTLPTVPTPPTVPTDEFAERGRS